MIINTAEAVLYNGEPVQAVICNGVTVWPTATAEGYRILVTNTSDSASNISIGLSAYSDGTLIYQHPATSASYRTTTLPDETRLVVSVITPSGYRAELSSFDNTLRFSSRDTGEYSTSNYSAKITANGTIDAYDYTNNTFYVSGLRFYEPPFSGQRAYGYPLTATYVSGDKSVLTTRKITYYYNNTGRDTTIASDTPSALADKPYKYVTASADCFARLRRDSVSGTAGLSARVCLGFESASATLNLKPSSYGDILSTSVAFSIPLSVTSLYQPSATASAGQTLNYMSFDVHLDSITSVRHSGGISASWYMEGIAP